MTASQKNRVAGEAGERRLALTGATNFRDLGGYLTEDGRQTRRGLLFRSDSLAELTSEDLAVVEGLGLRSVCDLRHESERQLKPNRALPASSPTIHNIGFFPHGIEALIEGLRAREVSPAQAASAMQEMYRRLPLDQSHVYAELFGILLRPDALPTLIHCTSGKDRTGFAAALVLSALGVRREAIIEDYVLSSSHRRDLRFMLGDDVDAETVAALTVAHPEYLAAAFASIDANAGSLENYLAAALGLDDAARQKLRELLLEDITIRVTENHGPTDRKRRVSRRSAGTCRRGYDPA